eukprot:10845867-Heterocapsa_arctica.AAC.1
MAIRKSKIKQWALRLNDGRFSSPETLVWEVAARIKHSVAATAAVKTGCNSTVVNLALGMYKKNRLIQVHKANTDLVPADGGILAGCGFA